MSSNGVDTRAAPAVDKDDASIADDFSSDFTSSVTNFSIQYNFGCAGMAMAIMLSHNDETGPGVVPDYPEPIWAKNYLLSIVFIGAMVGMLVMGALGDVIGLKRALGFTNTLTVIGAMSSAFLTTGSPEHVWLILTISRFILGVGVGGGYPLSAAKAAQSAGKGRSLEQTAKAFFWQGPGSVAPYLVALALLHLPHEAGVTGVQFRLLLGLGAVPAFIVVWCVSREATVTVDAVSKAKPSRDFSSIFVALAQRKYWRKLVGTAGTWFLFDVAFYGLMIFAPQLVTAIFGQSASLFEVAFHSMVLLSVSLVGFVLGIYLLVSKRASAKALNTFGFVASAVAFFIVAAIFKHAPTYHKLLFAMICAMCFALAVGPNVATFVLPVETFPPDVQGTFGGLSSASGKLGAMVGTIIFPLLVDSVQMSGAMNTMGVVCLVGGGMSHYCLKDRGGDASRPILPNSAEGAPEKYGS